MAVPGLVVAALVVGARLGVEQDRGNYRLHIAPYAAPVIGECRGNPLDVGRARIALHQMLDQDLADERPHVRMVENIVERVTHILLRRKSRRLRVTVHQLLRSHVMLGRIRYHRPGGIDVIVLLHRSGSRLIGETGKHARCFGDDGL
jgi:hypothetical protein